jgi:hypothetical protein
MTHGGFLSTGTQKAIQIFPIEIGGRNENRKTVQVQA